MFALIVTACIYALPLYDRPYRELYCPRRGEIISGFATAAACADYAHKEYMEFQTGRRGPTFWQANCVPVRVQVAP